jgi:hypothetical protein
MSESSELTSAKPGESGKPLDENDNVIRLGLEQSNYKEIGANHFRLSSTEKKQDWKRISVWETSLTNIDQVKSILTNPKRKLAMNLNVGDVRSIALDGQVELDVKWDRLSDCIDEDGNKSINYTKGCEGHCGLEGVYPKGKKLRKKLRKELANLAMSSECHLIED